MNEDPRIDELMEYLDSVDAKGEPTSIALIAKRVASYAEVVGGLREQLDASHSAIEELESRAENLATHLNERNSLRDDITLMAQDAAIKASFSTTSARGAQLRKDGASKQKELRQFESDLAVDEKRFKELNRALESGRIRLMEMRDQIARRMNIIDALLQRAEVDWPSYFFEENRRLKSAKGAAKAVVRPAARGRGRRRVVRRRRAS